jgi:hypothetical protein
MHTYESNLKSAAGDANAGGGPQWEKDSPARLMQRRSRGQIYDTRACRYRAGNRSSPVQYIVRMSPVVAGFAEVASVCAVYDGGGPYALRAASRPVRAAKLLHDPDRDPPERRLKCERRPRRLAWRATQPVTSTGLPSTAD